MSSADGRAASVQPALPAECAARLTALLATGRRCLLGIVGAPGSGKSTIAQAIKAQCGDQVQVLPMDGFHLANSELDRLGRRSRKGAPDTFDAAGYVSLLGRIKSQQAGDDLIYAPEFRRELEEGIAGAIAVPGATPLIVTEGNYLLLDEAPWNQVRQVLDEVWYVDVSDDLRRARLVARHMRFGRSEQEARDWVTHTDEPNALRIAQTRQCADLKVAWDQPL
jgi:pantothenate kinase